MSANPSDDALQRLNYFNGQRLVAADFRAEQGHHMGMRRVINRSLYSPGIVVGLEVIPAKSNPPDPQDKHRVIVKRGLAFDNLGREIFLPVDVSVQVMGAPRSAPGVVFGNLLVVSYRETRQFPSHNQCMAGAPFQPCSGDLAWGGPTRIVADAMFEFLDSWPSDDSGKIVLSQIELDAKCNVVRTSPGVRRYAAPAKPQTVHPLSLEGEKDIDKQNAKVLYFHIDGGAPESALLYLRGLPFSSLYYTELGKHTHKSEFPKLAIDIGHTHAFDGSLKTKAGQGTHKHAYLWDDGNFGAFDLENGDPDKWATVHEGDQFNLILDSGAHVHEMEAIQLIPLVKKLSVPVSGTNLDAGASDLSARDGKPALKLLKDLIVKFDGVSITSSVCDLLEARPGQAGKWRVTGSGGPADVRLNGATLSLPEGTGEIDLLKLGIEIGIGQHKLEFVVSDADVGGQIQYNLYVS
jgi:hypothetical protein